MFFDLSRKFLLIYWLIIIFVSITCREGVEKYIDSQGPQSIGSKQVEEK